MVLLPYEVVLLPIEPVEPAAEQAEPAEQYRQNRHRTGTEQAENRTGTPCQAGGPGALLVLFGHHIAN